MGCAPSKKKEKGATQPEAKDEGKKKKGAPLLLADDDAAMYKPEDGMRSDRGGFDKLLNEASAMTRADPKPVSEAQLQNWERLLHGDLECEVKARKRVIRVFTSSTFTDTKVERNALMADVYPYLRELCARLGYQFEVVDMRWGVREDTGDTHGTSELCMSEIAKCRRISAGPAFVTFLCDKYGYRPFPSKIPQTDFDKMQAYLLGKDAPGAHLLKEWFLLDENIVPPTYILQRISSKLPDYISKDRDARKKASDQWWQIFETLQELFYDAAQVCLPEMTALPYQVSVTHEEVINGVLENPQREQQVFVFRRYLNGIDERPGDVNARNFIDVKAGKIDTDATGWLGRLKDQLPPLLKSEQLIDSTLAWTNGGPQTDNPEFVTHVRKWCDEFANKIGRSILNAYQRDNHEEDPLVLEVRQHQVFMQERLKGAETRGDINEKILSYVSDIFNAQEKAKPSLFAKLAKTEAAAIPINRPLVITGAAGSGKTTALALGARAAKNLIRDKGVMCVRVCGSTTDSTDARSILASLCEQINRAYSPRSVASVRHAMAAGKLGQGKDVADQAGKKVAAVGNLVPIKAGGHDNDGDGDVDDDDEMLDEDVEYEEMPEDYDSLKIYFRERIERYATKSRPLFIFLDAVNQLSDLDHGRELAWLPLELPQFCGIVLTTDLKEGGCLEALHTELPPKTFPDTYLEIPSLSVSELPTLLKRLEETASRRLTDYQRESLLKAFEACPVPLYVKLCFENALTWSSYTPIDDIQIAPDIQSAIERLFDRLEHFHGKTLFSRALGYITLSKNGLTISELEDILSCDDVVLDDVFEWWVPPTRRIPPLLWIRIRNDLNQYLTERGSDGLEVYGWYHRQFHHAALERYCKPDVRREMHENMARYFMGDWATNGFPYTGKDGKKEIQNRKLQNQPLWISESVPNRRKVEELPYHLSRASLFQEVYIHCLGNLEFLEAKCQHVGGVHSLMQDYRESLNEAAKGAFYDQIKGFQRFFSSCAHLLQQDSARVWQLAFNTPDESLSYKAAMSVVEEGFTPQVEMCMGWEHKSQADDPCLKTFTNLHLPFLAPDAQTIGTVDPGRNIIQLWDVNTRALVNKLKVESEKEIFPFWKKDMRVTCPVYSHTGNEIAFATADESVNIWVIADQTEYRLSPDVAKVSNGIAWMKWSADDTQLLICDKKGYLRPIMLKRPGIDNPEIPEKKGGMFSGMMGGKKDDGEAELYITGHLRKYEKFAKHAEASGCTDAAFHPNGAYIVSVGFDDTVWVWRIDNGFPELQNFNMAKFWMSRIGRAKKTVGFAPNKRDKRSVSFSPDGQTFLYSSPKHTIRIATELLPGMKGLGKEHVVRLRGMQGFARWSPDSQAVVGGGRPFKIMAPGVEIPLGEEVPENKRAKKRFAETNAHLEPFNNYHRGRVQDAVWSADGSHIVSRDESSVKLWLVKDAIKAYNEEIVTPSHEKIAGCAISADGKYVVTCGADNTFRVWDTTTWKEPIVRKGYRTEADQFASGLAAGFKSLPSSISSVTSVDISSDNALVAAASSSGNISVVPTFDVEDSGRVLVGHTRRVTHVRFSPDSERIASCSVDESIRIWSVEEYKTIYRLTGHSKTVQQVAWGPDSNTLVSAGGRDRTIRFWDLDRADELELLKNPDQEEGDGEKKTGIMAQMKKEVVGAVKDVQNLISSRDYSYHVIQCENAVNCIAVSEDGCYVAAGIGPTLRIYSYVDWDGEPEQTKTEIELTLSDVQKFFKRGLKQYTNVSFDPYTTALVAAAGNSIEWHSIEYPDDEDYDYEWWDEDEEENIELVRKNTFMTLQKVTCVAAHPDFNLFVGGDGTGSIYVLRPRDQAFLESLERNKEAAAAAAAKVAAEKKAKEEKKKEGEKGEKPAFVEE